MRTCFATLLLILCIASAALAQAGDSLQSRLWWNPGIITALPILDSLTQTQALRSVDLDFDHTSSLYNWAGSTQLFFPAYDSHLSMPSVAFSSEARSELRQDTRTRTNEGTAYLFASIPVKPTVFALTGTLLGDTYSLNRPNNVLSTLFSSIERLSDGYALAGVRYDPIDELDLQAKAGASYKSFLYGQSSGTIFQVQASTEPLEVADASVIDLNARLDERTFPSLSEASHNDGGRIHYLTSLGDGGSDEASVSVQSKRQDFYFAVDSLAPYARQERREQTVEIHNSLHYPISPEHVDLFIDANVIPKTIHRTTKGIDFSTATTSFLTSSTFLLPSATSTFDLDLSSRFVWRTADASSVRSPTFGAMLRYTESSQNNTVSSSELAFATPDLLKRLSGIFSATSFDGRQSIFSLDAAVPLPQHDVLSANINTRLFRYDTPSEDNHDDRDELYLNSAIEYAHRFSDELSSSAQLRLAKSHLVYLKSDRSAQNFTAKTITLALSTRYQSAVILHSISAEVFSNYSVYDFSLPSVDPTVGRDYLIRGADGTDSLGISLGRLPIFTQATGSISTNLNLRLYERGSYNVDAFSERPLLRTTELSGELTFDINEQSTSSPALIKVGARLFYQLRSALTTPMNGNDLVTTLGLQARISRFGPLMIVIFDENKQSGFRLYGSLWYSVLSQEQFDINQSSSNPLIEGRLAIRWSF